MELDFETCYRAVAARDTRFDGRFYTAVLTTGVYCRPVCPARTPYARNVRFFHQAAAAERAGFRACRRCRPETGPDSPDWDVRADLVGRGLRLIADGLVDTDGIGGLAARLAVSERHLHRSFVVELGVGPLAVARTRRAQLARQLLDQTRLPVSEVAFSAGFASLRAFNTALRSAYGGPPSTLRGSSPAADAGLTLRLGYRPPLAAGPLLDFLAARAIPGVEQVVDGTYRRTVPAEHGGAVLELTPADGYVLLRVRGADPCRLAGLVAASRRLLDLDADPAAVAAVLSRDPALAPLVAARPGLRLVGAFDGFELAVRAVLGQQVSVTAARTLAGRLAALAGAPLAAPDGPLTRLFPTPAAVAEADLSRLGLTSRRAATLRALATAVARGEIVLDGSVEPAAIVTALRRLPGVGEWTASYIALRALRDPDAFPAGDLGLRRALTRLRMPDRDAALVTRAHLWRPWRGYAATYLWTHSGED